VFPSYLKTVEQVNMFPAAEFGHLTLELNGKHLRPLWYRVLINCMGLNAEESESRAQIEPSSRNDSLRT